MKRLPIGFQTFSKMIQGNYLYVDKTKEIYNLFANGSQYYFLSRPRRFGKSLLITTLAEIFLGNKELFKDLWIYDKIEWDQYPVIHLDFSNVEYDNAEILKKSLSHTLDKIAANYKVTLSPQLNYKSKFIDLIEALAKKGRVVVLVDEYDKPIIDFIEKDKRDIAIENRDILRNFYSVIKGSDKYIKFVFITGVSKFSKVSVFSGLNNLNDITIDNQFTTLLGYTHHELLHYFSDRIKTLADSLEMSVETITEKIRAWYNGYSWDGKNFVYNPFSILLLLQKNVFDNYWFSTGTPSFLTHLIKEKNQDIADYENLKVGSYIFESFDIERIEVASLLFQTGYLTIKKTKMEHFPVMDFWLGYPNVEVRQSFLRHLLTEYTGKDFTENAKIVAQLTETIETARLTQFFDIIRSLFASIPYNIFIGDRESYYHTVIYLVLRLMGVRIQSEVQTHTGRIDAVIETANHIYIMEFKLGTPEDALKQVKEKKYYEKYLTSKKSITLAGIGFDKELRNITDYKIETLKS